MKTEKLANISTLSMDNVQEMPLTEEGDWVSKLGKTLQYLVM